MPIHLEEVVAPEMPAPLLDAMMRIADAALGRTVTPGIAIGLLRSHVAPLLPPDCHALFHRPGQPSWERLQVLYAELLCRSGGDDLALVAAAFIVDVVWRHSTHPPRQMVFEDTVDVASFLRMASYARLIVARSIRLPSGRGVETLRFCRYCWRPARTIAGVCTVHSVQRNPMEVAQYKEAQRLKASFHQELLSLATQEELEFHDSGFTAPVFFPDANASQWLAVRRPLLLRAVLSDSEATLGGLMQHLFGTSELFPMYAGQPYLMTPVTLRAEAWLRAKARKGTWGGRRAGAGTKPKNASGD